MPLKLLANSNSPPIGGLLTASFVKAKLCVSVEWGKESALHLSPDVVLESNPSICRYLGRFLDLHGSSSLEQTEVDHWISFSIGPLSCTQEFIPALKYLDEILGPVSYLVANRITIADLIVWGNLLCNQNWIKVCEAKSAPYKNIHRWYSHIQTLEEVAAVVSSLPEAVLSKTKKEIKSVETKDEGKFVELPGATKGKVVVRFPPEASGYLHIGHAKAALLNAYYQEAFQGQLIMRFDDTNPDKEKVDFEKVILEDLQLLQIKPDRFTHTSDHFDSLLKYCEKMLKEGKAYVDDTDPETMKQEREQRTESMNRSNTVERNLFLWLEMLNGSGVGQKCCVRAKINMKSDNGCMRDPTIYRCKTEPHPKTGTKYKVYPTYDFACPIVDSVEGVTHALRTMEYHDRDEQFYWFIDTLGLRKPFIWEYARLNMMNTVLSKRKLTWFVQQGIVESWEDPRFPTVRGVLRRGMTVEGLKQFIIAQGSSRSVVQMEWDKIWAFNKKVIDPVAPRFTAIQKDQLVPVKVEGATKQSVKVAKHPKNPSVGEKIIWPGPDILIQADDAEQLKEGENATFINWGNLRVRKIHRDGGGKINRVDADPDLGNTDFKKTLKLTWLHQANDLTPVEAVYYDHIITKPVLAKDEDFQTYINHDSKHVVSLVGDPELQQLKQGDIVQLQRVGYFRCDVAATKDRPLVLINIPDGSTKGQTNKPDKPELSFKEQAASSRGKDTERSPLDEAAKTPAVATAPLTEQQLEGLADQWRLDRQTLIKQEPGVEVVVTPAGAEDYSQRIKDQGDVVRDLKARKADKGDVEAAVKLLLTLKADYKAATGQDWKPTTGTVQPTTPAKPTAAAVEKNKSPGAQNQHKDNIVSNVVCDLLRRISDQGDKIRKLKAEKAGKAEIDSEVKQLLTFKTEYKNLTGQEWMPNVTPAKVPEKMSSNELSTKITEQGDKVRTLKTSGGAKAAVDAEVKELLRLKAEFKASTGQEWKPNVTAVAQPASVPPVVNSNPLSAKITEQGDKVRTLKTSGGAKAAVDAEVKEFLRLKAEFKAATGQEWKPNVTAVTQPASVPPVVNSNPLSAKITEQGDKVRTLKTSGGAKEAVDAEVKELLRLKAEFKAATGQEWKPEGGQNARSRGGEKTVKGTGESKQNKPSVGKQSKGGEKQDKGAEKQDAEEKSGLKKQTRLGLEALKEDNLADWYSQVITKGELLDYYDVSGCYILRPWAFSVWETIRDFIDSEIKGMGVENCYFPMFVSKAMLEKEKAHIADFSPEVAWVTRSGDSELAEHIAIRPTSETVMYPAYAKWIQSYRDLPLRLNQWNNVVRWEFKHPQPFLRTREFLWQEGHTAFASEAEAEKEVLDILDLYARVYTDLLAIPVVRGRKTEKEKFAGGSYTTTVEAFVAASGRAIQGATSHHLGLNFSKMFDIVYEDPETQEKQFVYQNSWGITTRTIGVMIMIHGDNMGLVLPPKVASLQVVIVPCGITANLKAADKDRLMAQCVRLEKDLRTAGVRVKLDQRDNYSPGWKFNHWELKGVPVRVELGPKDLDKEQLVAVRRDTAAKVTLPLNKAVQNLISLLESIQQAMLDKATTQLKEHTVLTSSWTEFCTALDLKNIIVSPFCGLIPCEDNIKKDSTREQELEPGAPAMGAKSLCIPFQQPAPITDKDRCIHPACSAKPVSYTLFGRSY